jgi:phenylpropionate dioxygenase-like ring-hydroxylating dioxygenase large terminal subunit
MADPIQHGSASEPIVNPELRTNKNQYARWEYEHIGRVIGFYQKGKRNLVKTEARMVDEVHVAEANGTAHIFYFDVTAQVKPATPEPVEPRA